MTGAEFERLVADLFQKNGFWALRIPKNERGAQPFDILAIRGDVVYAVDCKVCERKYFSLNRIEDNQWISMDVMKRKTNAVLGFVIFHNERLFFVSYDEAFLSETASIHLDDKHLWEVMQ